MPQQWAPKKPIFGQPPPGYIAGLGRGATGFITRSDLGPARIPNSINVSQVEIDDAAYAESKYDEWQGYKIPLFSKDILDQEDKQAQEAFNYCQEKVGQRREKQKQQLLKIQEKKSKDIDVLADKFTDIKRQLSTISQEEWQNIPDAIDSSIKKRKRDRYVPMIDTMIVNLLSSKESNHQINETEQDFREIKQILLKSNLDHAQDNVHGKSVVDKLGYLTQLSVNKANSQYIGDLNKARLLLKSATQSNPSNSDLWISAARIQQLDGKIEQCRQILRKAIQHCQKNEDIWIQLSNVQKVDQAKNVIIQALRHLPNSQKLWLYAANQQDSKIKSMILRKGLENIPQSINLWRQIIELEDSQEAKNLLNKAVKCLPHEIDLWTALAKLQTYENAKVILNKARKANPLNISIWVNAAKLEETQSNDIDKIKNKIEQILVKGRQILKKNGNNVTRNQWMQQAYYCQRSSNIICCQIMIKSFMFLQLTEEQIFDAVLKDAILFQKQKQSEYTTRFIYKYGVKVLKNKIIFEKMIDFERRQYINNKINQNLMQTLKLGVDIFSQEINFWVILIDNLINYKEYQTALNLIHQSINKIPIQSRQKINLEKIKIFKINNKINQARIELEILKKLYPNGDAFIEAIKLQYQFQNYEKAWNLCQEMIVCLRTEQFWILAYKCLVKIGTYQQCCKIFEKSLKIYPNSQLLWYKFIQLEIKNNFIGKARTLLDKALINLPKCEQLYILNIQMELQQTNKSHARFILAKALKELPKSSNLWALAIELQPHSTQRKKANTAIQQCGTTSCLSCSVGRLFWKDDKIEKAKKWLQQALKIDRQNGDAWIYYIRLITEKYPSLKDQVLLQFNQTTNKLHGNKWKKAIEQENLWKQNNIEILNNIIQNMIIEQQKYK